MPQTARSREEWLNAISHGAGFLGALVMAPLLIHEAARTGSTGNIVGSAVFAGALILMYLASTWYHAAHPGPLKSRLQRLDHAAIYLLIAGSYTPFTLGVLSGTWGWTLFGIVWGAAGVGIIAKLTMGDRFPRLSTITYLLMGWSALLAIKPLVENTETLGLVLIAAGGVFYSAGVIFYVNQRLRYAHFIWHLFVLAGSTSHVFAVLWYSQ
jgi:hemolysin III